VRIVKHKNWIPLSEKKIAEIRKLFQTLYPDTEYNDLADKITEYWVQMLRKVWKNKSAAIKAKDRAYQPADPLSRIRQKTVVIAYADSIRRIGEASLVTLDTFLGKYFPAVGGLHMLPACAVAENRFNDGYFSQVVRNKIHTPFGTNRQFADLMEKYYAMADFVLNHVDIENPAFQSFLDNENTKGDCFYVYSEEEYRQHQVSGDFSKIFRPRPFPLFTVFRKKPENKNIGRLSHLDKVREMNRHFSEAKLPEPVISLLSIFNKIKNDQMLLTRDYQHIFRFRNYLLNIKGIDPDSIFRQSTVQESQDTPYTFDDHIITRTDLLEAIGYDTASARRFSETYGRFDAALFGEEIRALTTFSHVQVDLNTSTEEGLKMLADDFSWYLGMDLNMLRLDAANFAFKKWNTTCFGLPEVALLMKILYLSIDCVAPRIVANLEVNDQLGNILSQMADKKAPPPMMYDFHLACILPVVFNSSRASILLRIFQKIAAYDIPKESIRFSLTESHDGKSVRGSMDLLTFTERQLLADTVEANGGRIKFQSVTKREYSRNDFQAVCEESGLDFAWSRDKLFQKDRPTDPILYLNDKIRNENDMAAALDLNPRELNQNGALKYFIKKSLEGKEPYELCVSTRDALIRIQDKPLEVNRYLAFYTLAFSLMGRNVKSIYFNDLLGLPNDDDRIKASGELRDIKRTKSLLEDLEKTLQDTNSFSYHIARGINHLIGLVDADPALYFRGNEAQAALPSGDPPPVSVAIIHNRNHRHHSLCIVNTGRKPQNITIDPKKFDLKEIGTYFDNISGRPIALDGNEKLNLTLQPFQRLWLSKNQIDISPDRLMSFGQSRNLDNQSEAQ